MLRGCSGAGIALLPFSQCSGIVRIEKKKSSTEITGMVFPKRRASVTEREKGIVYHPAIKLLRGVGTFFCFYIYVWLLVQTQRNLSFLKSAM